MVIFGESHFDALSRNFIEQEIIKRKPAVIVHELLYDSYIKKQDIQLHLDSCSIGGVCDPLLNKDIFQLGLAVGADLIGCDLSQLEFLKIKNKPLNVQFKVRELHMLKTIKHVLKREKNICVVVGDIHLRTFRCKALGAKSCLSNAFNDVEIIRASVVA